jgi:hypothetical protein
MRIEITFRFFLVCTVINFYREGLSCCRVIGKVSHYNIGTIIPNLNAIGILINIYNFILHMRYRISFLLFFLQ